jgi:hypothetical protein
MSNKVVMPLVVAAGLAMAGCLQKETSHTLYVSPDGAVAWTVGEANVRSDESDETKRHIEEREYVSAALLGTHGAARALSALGPVRPVRTLVVREERPFQVVTDARFSRIDRVLERLFTKSGFKSAARFDTDGVKSSVRVQIDLSSEIPDADGAVLDGFLDVEHFRFVLTEGLFDEVSGFDVRGGTSAVFSAEWLEAAERASREKRPIEFVLAWTR